ncbi:MAG: multifunctional CCA addition/repair protein [Xanthomonadaceae bacterium]|nr:multifunctional CCA addition/repair protein [Xanthomonadaceae bacterium]
MKTYLVGGAVRDALLGLAPGDRDWVVVGESPESMMTAGFRPVGADFPVFLHPRSGEEYALARTERKSAPGYKGFVFHADPQVTLEQDLARRDFTVNAIARDADGSLIDPFNGRSDLQARVLRHVSPAFAEDPVRILRAARFMARFAHLGFSLAPETVALMRSMVVAGEVDHLVPERIWQEVRAALASRTPSAFLQTLHACGALAVLLPEVEVLYGIPQRPEYHPEIDAGHHIEMVCDMAARLAPGDALIGFAALLHDLGKGLTPAEDWPKHIAHEHHGLTPVQSVCARWKVPSEYAAMAVHACREHLNMQRLQELRPEIIHELLTRLDAFRRPGRVAQLALICEADKRGRLGMTEDIYTNGDLLQRCFLAASSVRAGHLSGNPTGPAIGEALRKARIEAIAAAKEA